MSLWVWSVILSQKNKLSMLGQRATEPTQRKKTACKPTDLFYVLPFSH